jgi:hypothetical protein
VISPEKVDDKFETQDLPKILAAIHNARQAKSSGSVTIHFSENGGVISVLMETKKKFK